MAVTLGVKEALKAGGANFAANASGVWGWYVPEKYQPNAFDSDLKELYEAGGRVVRLVISMDTLEEGSTGKLEAQKKTDLLAFIRRSNNEGLIVIVDVHQISPFYVPGQGTTWNEDYAGALKDTGTQQRHTALCVELARLIKDNGLQEKAVLGMVNEPIFTSNKQVWYDYQKNKLYPAVRAAAPDIWLMITSHDWQGFDAAVYDLKVGFGNPKDIVDLHLYEPMSLTHTRKSGESLTWPGRYSQWYADESKDVKQWDASTLEARIKFVADWANKNGLFINVSEFGTKAIVNEAARAAYLGDVTRLFRKYGFGWQVYDFAQKNFGVKQHPKVLKALWPDGSPTEPTDPPIEEPEEPAEPEQPPNNPIPKNWLNALPAEMQSRVLVAEQYAKAPFDEARLGDWLTIAELAKLIREYAQK